MCHLIKVILGTGLTFCYVLILFFSAFDYYLLHKGNIGSWCKMLLHYVHLLVANSICVMLVLSR